MVSIIGMRIPIPSNMNIDRPRKLRNSSLLNALNPGGLGFSARLMIANVLIRTTELAITISQNKWK